MISYKNLLKLTQKKHRREQGLCIVEGEKIVRELAPIAVQVFVRGGTGGSAPYTVLSEKELKAVSDLETNQGILAVVPIPKPREVTFPYLVLDGIQDPGNMGTLLRTAAAFGFNTVFCLDCVDVWSQKVLRAGVGTQFKLNIWETNFEGFKTQLSKLKNNKLFVADVTTPPPSEAPLVGSADAVANKFGELVADCKSQPGSWNKVHNSPPWRGGHAERGRGGLVLGNEGNGVSAQIKSLPHEVVTIPMNDGVESLNVAVAGGILMYELGGRK